MLSDRARPTISRGRAGALLVLLAIAGCGPKSFDAKMKDAEKLVDQISGLLDQAEAAINSAEPKEAEEALTEAGELLAEPDLSYSPERDLYKGRHAELLPRLAEAREARRLKDIEEAVTNERAEIGPSLQAMKDAAEAISGAKVDAKLIDDARDSVSALEKAVGASDERRLLALKEPSFLGYLKRAKAETEKARAEVTRAEKKLKFVNGPVALKLKAADELKASKKERNAEKKRALIASAASGYGRCFSSGTEFTRGGFGAEKVMVGAATTSVESLLDSCKAAQETTEKALAKLPKPKPAPAVRPKKKK